MWKINSLFIRTTFWVILFQNVVLFAVGMKACNKSLIFWLGIEQLFLVGLIFLIMQDKVMIN